MNGPGSTITITIEALTEQANAKLTSFLAGLDTKLNSALAKAAAAQSKFFITPTNPGLKRILDDIGDSATKSGARIAGMSYYFRSAMDGIRLAFAGGGARAAFYSLDEAVRGLAQSGGKLRESLISVGLELVEIGPLVGTAVLGWLSLNEILSRPTPLVQYLAKQNSALKEQADWLQIVQKLHAAGAINSQQATRDSDFNFGSTSDLMGRGLVMGSKEGAKPTQTGQAFMDIADVMDQLHVSALDETGKKLDEIDAKFLSLKNAAQVAGQTLVASGKMSQAAYDALLASIEAAHERASNNTVDAANFKNQQAKQEKEAAMNAATSKSGLAEIELQNVINESSYKRGLISLQQYLEKRRLLITVTAAEEAAPLQKSIDALTSQLEEKTKQIGALDLPGKVEAQKQIDALQVKIKELNAELTAIDDKRKKSEQDTADLADQGSFKSGIQSWLNEIDKQPSFGAHAATSFKDTWTSAINGVSSSISGLIMGTKTWGQTLIAIGNTAATALVENFVKLGVEWVNTHVLMAAVSKLFHATETADTAANTSAQVGIHAAGETAKTSATGAQVIARGALRLAETIYHGLQVALRVGAQVLGEIAMTAASVVQSMIRRVAAFLEAQPYIFLAAVKAATAVADIPIVGPILAPIAAATTFAALEALAVFKQGGYTGDGPTDQIAGLVHRGEVVIPAERVQQTGVGRLMQFVRSGRFSPSDANIDSSAGAIGGSGAGGAVIQHKTQLGLAIFGGEADAKRWAEGQGGETWFLNQMDKHAYKYQRT
jgi:hypothetical protein